MSSGSRWTLEQRRRAAILGPTGGGLWRADTRLVARDGWYQVVTPSAPGSVLNEIVLSEVAEEDAERVIDEAIETYGAIGKPVKWCVGPWTRPRDFGERLARRGFTSWGVRGMGCETTLDVAAPAEIAVREVTAEEVDRFIAVSNEGWGVTAEQADGARASFVASFTESPRIAWLFAATIGEEWVGTAALLLRGDYAYLLAAQVLERARGKGAYRALIAVRLAFLRERGIGYAVTHAREATSAPMLEHLGFETLFRSKCYVREPRQETALLAHPGGTSSQNPGSTLGAPSVERARRKTPVS